MDIKILSQYQSYRYDTFHYCPSISPTDTTQSITVSVSVLLIWYSPSTCPTDMIYSTTAPAPVLLIRQYQSYWYDTIHYCPYTSPYIYDTVHYNLSTSSVDVHYCHIASPTDTTQSTSVPVPVLRIWYSPPIHQPVLMIRHSQCLSRY